MSLSAVPALTTTAISGSANNYDIEFTTYLDQTLKHLKAATDIADKSRLQA